MSRARAQSGPTISLFPFLAVLLCTMGSLLVVLVIFSRSAKLAGIAAAETAREAAAAAAADERQELELAREELGWRIDHVRSMRDRTADDLAKARMQLAGTEENARQLADELDALARVIEALESEAAQADDQTILELERKLAEARMAVSRSSWYTDVPRMHS
jgi:septal ring factor EnvC (AmiA/AmiB activator)